MNDARPDMVLVLPSWQPSLISEYAALPWLAAHAAANGYAVETLNLNRDLLLGLAAGKGVEQLLSLLREAVRELEGTGEQDAVGMRFYLGARRALGLAEQLADEGGDTLSARLEGPLHLLRLLSYLDEGMGGWVDPTTRWGDIGARIWRALSDPVIDAAVAHIAARQPRSVGFCAPYSEVVPALFDMLSRLRAALGPIHVAVGGPAAALASEDALQQALDAGVDSIIRYNAEDSFLQLLEAVRGERSFDEVENRLSQGRPITEVSHVPPRTRMSKLPARSYHFDAPLLRPVNLLAAHGCYWGKCAYCCYSALHGPTQSYRSRAPEAVVDEVEAIHRRYGARHFLLSAESLPRRFCREFARGLLGRALDVRWCCFVRPGPWYDLETLDLMAKSGFDARWSVSIEAGSDAILQRMRRGYTKQHLLEFFDRCRTAGIVFGWANVIHDFPGTTYEEALETFELVEQQLDLIRQGVSLNRYRLKVQSAMGARPQDWGLTDVVWRGGDEATFRNTTGMSLEEVERIERRYADLALRFRPEARDVARLRAALERGDTRGLRVRLSEGAVASCPSAFDREGRLAAGAEQLALHPRGGGDEIFYYQYNVGEDLARASVLDAGERALAQRLFGCGDAGLPVDEALAALRGEAREGARAAAEALCRLLGCGAELSGAVDEVANAWPAPTTVTAAEREQRAR